MNKKQLQQITIVFLLLSNISGCSIPNNITYRPTINQGNYINYKDLIKIQIGMKKQSIFSTLGTPILHDPFGSNKYYYIFYKISNHQQPIQKTLILTFNDHDKLISIEYEIY